jgi:serine/threonine protein kinase
MHTRIEQREGCQLEIQLLQSLEHPGIVEYVESFQLPKSSMLCIVMAFCEGGDLTNFVKKQRSMKLAEKDVLDYFVQMALALHYMHSRNILHRDLKTQNIFLKNGFLKLGDFGISKILDNSMDFAQTCIGTPYYMSPELFKNKPYNFKSGMFGFHRRGGFIFELGVTLFVTCFRSVV